MSGGRLAGLTYEFQPVSLQPVSNAKGDKRRSVDRPGSQQARPDSNSGVGSDGGGRLNAARHNSGRSVSFNLNARKAGPAYSSPEPDEDRGAGHAGEESSSRQASPAAGSPAAPHGEAVSRPPAALAHLKLASLRRRAAAQPGSTSAELAAQLEGLGGAAAGGAAAGQPGSAAQLAHDVHSAQATAAVADAQQAALLSAMETQLAGCSSGVLQEPPPSLAPPHHVQVGWPVLHIPPLAAEGQQSAGLSAAQQASSSAPQVDPPLPVADDFSGQAGGSDAAFQIAAFRPAAGIHDGSRALSPCTTDAESDDGMPQAAASANAQPQPPAGLEAALRCLGLLPSSADNSSAGGVASSRTMQSETAGPGEQQWVRLRAVQVALSAKRDALAASELLPLARRLRQVGMHLVFHQANLRRGRSRSPGASAGQPSAAPPPGPWLSGRSSADASKHRSSRSGSPGAQQLQRGGAARPSREASELQVQLLGGLQQKLLLKLGLAALRHAAATTRLRSQLLRHAAARAAADMCRSALLGWHDEAVPSQSQVARALALARMVAARRQQAQLTAWRDIKARSMWRRCQLAVGQAALRRRLLAAAVQHWRCYCQQQLVLRLQAALAARWVAAWGRRRIFLAWRRTASRSAQLKAALLDRQQLGNRSRSGLDDACHRPQLPSQLDALSATSAAFQPVKAFVAEAAQQLGLLRQGLRFAAPGRGRAALGAAAQLEGLEGQGRRQQQDSPLALGSVEALLASFPPAKPPHLASCQQHAALPAAACSQAQQATGAAAGLNPQHASVMSAGTSGGAARDRARVSAPREDAAAVDPAPDPGSPTGYNPATYASPPRHGHSQRQQRGPAKGRREAAAAAALPPEALEAELLECQERVLQLHQELQELEQESQHLQQRYEQLQQASQAEEQAVRDQQQACKAADAAKAGHVAAVQAAAQEHAAAAAECSACERLVQQRQQESQEASAAAAGAQAAVHAATELHALASMGVQRWSKAVEGVARELAACHRTQQAPVVVRLKEARQRLDQHKQEAAVAQQQLPHLKEAAAQAEQRAQQARQALTDAEQRLVAAAEQRCQLQQRLNAAMAQHEAAAVAAVAAAQEASAAEQRQRLLASQLQAAAGRLRVVAQQVLRKQEEAHLLQRQVQQLQQRHRDAVAAELAAAASQQQRRTLKRRLRVLQEQGQGQGHAALPSPPAMQQRRPPPVAGLSSEPSIWDDAGAPVCGLHAAGQHPSAAAPVGDMMQRSNGAPAGQLVPAQPSISFWSCSSSEAGSAGPCSADSLPPLTVEEAADRFSAAVLLRRAVGVLRQEAAAACSALEAAAAAWQRKQLAAVLFSWRHHAAEAAEWLATVSSALRRRGLLRRWRAVAAQQRWLRQAEAAADGALRRRLLVRGLEAWRQHVRHETWRDAVHSAVVELRMRNMVLGWRQWAKRRLRKAARLRSALAVYHSRLLRAALQHWCWLHRGKAVLRRVFSTAVDLWREEVGARLHQRNYELVAAAWRAWQVFVLQAEEGRRQAMLEYAADAHREKQLLAAGLAAFQREVLAARERRRLARLQACMLVAWRRLAATSARHWEYEAARQQQRASLAREALEALRWAADDTAAVLAQFWLRWQVQEPLRRVLLAWRACAAAQHQERVQSSVARVYRERRLQQAALAALAAHSAASVQRAISSCSQLEEASQQRSTTANRAVQSSTASQLQQLQRWQTSSQPGCRAEATSITTTVVISRERADAPQAGLAGQKQRRHASPACGSSCSGASGRPEAPQGASSAVSDWRAAADYWRQRHNTYRQQQQQQHDQQQQELRLQPHTAATLVQIRAVASAVMAHATAARALLQPRPGAHKPFI